MLINNKFILNIKVFTDLIIVIAVFFGAALLAQPYSVLASKPEMFILLFAQLLLWVYSASLTKIHDDFSVLSWVDFISRLARIIIMQTVFSVVFIFFAKELLYTRYFIFNYAVLLGVGILVKSVFLKYLIDRFKSKVKNARKFIIIGSGETGKTFRDYLLKYHELDYSFAGFIDSDKDSSDQLHLGNFEQLEEVIATNGINDAVIALAPEKLTMLDDILRVCDRNAVRSFVIPDYLNFIGGKFKIELLGNFPIINVRNNPLDETSLRLIKRTFDIVFSLLFLLTFGWWLFLLIGLIIKIDSRGNVFFVQDRLGRDNKTFRCLKFRTMTTTASKKTDKFKVVEQRDNRITKIGNLLRKYNLDELPQFVNVLKGEMSIVGPRPHAIPFNDSYQEIVEEIKLRHRVKPGISGWAQIHGLRGDVIDMEEQKKRTQKRIQFDIWYIENWSMWLDLKIISETVLQVIFNRNTGY